MPARTVVHGQQESCANFSQLPTAAAEGHICEQEDRKNQWFLNGSYFQPLRTVCVRYDFSVHGGAAGKIDLTTQLPPGCVIHKGLVHVTQAVLSNGSATLGFEIEGPLDLLGATAKASLSAAAFIDAVPAGTTGTVVHVSGARSVKAVIGTAAITQGKVDLHLEVWPGYYDSAENESSSSSSSSLSSSSNSSSSVTSSSSSSSRSSATSSSSSSSSSRSSVTSSSSSSSSNSSSSSLNSSSSSSSSNSSSSSSSSGTSSSSSSSSSSNSSSSS